jgi:hypothetical protein
MSKGTLCNRGGLPNCSVKGTENLIWFRNRGSDDSPLFISWGPDDSTTFVNTLGMQNDLGSISYNNNSRPSFLQVSYWQKYPTTFCVLQMPVFRILCALFISSSQPHNKPIKVWLISPVRQQKLSWFIAYVAVYMRHALFHDFTQCRMEVSYRRFGTTYRPHLQMFAWPLKMGPIAYPVTRK